VQYLGDLGQDRDRDLGRRAGADAEPDRPVDALQLAVVEAGPRAARHYNHLAARRVNGPQLMVVRVRHVQPAVGIDDSLRVFEQRGCAGTVFVAEIKQPGADERYNVSISFDWYRVFIQALLDAEAYTWFGKAVAYGELLVGIALVLGAFTGIAAFFGALMNWNFMMAGSASTNPLLFVIAIALILAWKVAGYYGADYFLLRWLGTPWAAKKRSSKDPELAPA